MSRIFYVILNLLLIIICIDRLVTQSVNVTLKGGQINGQQIKVDDKNVSVFLGIPYAKPPIGELRFKKPAKMEEWSDAINATKWPNPCVQAIPDGFPIDDSNYKNTNFSEDCLYLNIWTPFDIKNNSSDQLKAVMFWIHGGGLMQGSSVESYYGGDILSTKGDVIVVTINYRLNVFGFFYSGTDDAPGNVGLWDQALALQWVNDNIRYFGGDPNKITIFGESSGSWSVSILLLSPITRNLYQNAIMMSGAVISEEVFDYPSISKSKWLYRAKQIGCNDTNNKSSDSTPKILDCLRGINAKTLQTITYIRDVNDTHLLNPFVVIDGTFLPDTPLNLIKTGAYKKNVNLLIGTMEDEGQLTLSSIDPVKYSATSPQNLTHTEATEEVMSLLSYQYLKAKINGEDVAKVYFNEISQNSTDYDLLRRTIGIAFGDYFLSCPTILFAKSVFESDRNGSNVYQYYFTSKIGSLKLGCVQWMGACHEGDVWPAFGWPFKFGQSLDEEKDESLRVIDFFAHFAKHGYPSSQNGISWPKYYTVNDVVIKPYFELSSHLNKSVTQFNNQLKVVECDYLFNKYILQQ